jgi:formylglycine-generating enzyme required for sulfatase activity
VRDEVVRATVRQEPFTYGSLVGEEVFLNAAGSAPPGPTLPPARTLSGEAAERAWALVKDSPDLRTLEAFRKQYGAANGVYDRLAELRIAELERRDPAFSVRPGSKESFRDCDVCPEMVVVPAGSFMMGSSEAEIEALVKTTDGTYSRNLYRSEGPQHRVTIARPFAVGKFEVTFAEWDACVAEGGCRHNPRLDGNGRGRRPVHNIWISKTDGVWSNITQEYLPWLSLKTGKTYRLLTEAEWEYAARAGTTTRYAFGNTITKSLAHYRKSVGESISGSVEVGSFRANEFGLHDMHGNVEEWVQDCWNANYKGAPSDGSAWTTGDCGRRVLRGGTYLAGDPLELRSAARSNAEIKGFDLSEGVAGFRVARTLDR